MLKLLFLLILASLVLAAKRRRRRRNFQSISVDTVITLGAVGDKGMVKNDLTAFGITKFRCVATDLIWTANGQTVNEAPILFGVANSNLSTAEIAEMLDAVPNSQTDIIALERVRRPVRQIGVFHGQSVNTIINDGKVVRTKFHTVLDEGTEVTAWARNESGATLTTGMTIHCFGRVYGYWI